MPLMTPSTTQQLQDSARSLSNRMADAFRLLQKIYADTYAFLWVNDNVATPQDAFNAFGADAAELAKLAGAYATMVGTYTGTAPPTAAVGYTVAPNQDGTVTVAAPTPPQPPTPEPTPDPTPAP